MRHLANIDAVAELRPDYMGFIFFHGSKRFVGHDFKIPKIENAIISVGVFVNQTSKQINELAKRNGISYLQLHGNETPIQCEELKNEGYTLIKAFQISEDVDFSEFNLYKSVVDFFLFDTKAESYGGSGKSFNWNILTKYDQEIPFFLSGGISLTNANEALNLRNLNIHALDVNSKFEIEPGTKDVDKLKSLFELTNNNYELRTK